MAWPLDNDLAALVLSSFDEAEPAELADSISESLADDEDEGDEDDEDEENE